MNRIFFRSTMAALLAGFTLATPTLLSAAGSERQEHTVLAAKSGGSLTFNAAVGSIEIQTHDRDEITYDAVVESGGWFSRWFGGGEDVVDQLEFNYEHSDGDVKITMKWKDDKRPRSVNLNAHHTLWIPARYNIDVKTAGGKIEGKDINGMVAAHTSGGSIRFGNVSGIIKAHTSGGSITLGDIKGNANIRTSGGSINVRNVEGDLAAHTSGGSIKVGSVAGELKGRTSGGSISAEITKQITQPLELRTSGGSIHLAAPDGFQADLTANTSGGKVSCDFPLDGSVKKNSVDGQINGGGPQVTLRTSGGSIQISHR